MRKTENEILVENLGLNFETVNVLWNTERVKEVTYVFEKRMLEIAKKRLEDSLGNLTVAKKGLEMPKKVNEVFLVIRTTFLKVMILEILGIVWEMKGMAGGVEIGEILVMLKILGILEIVEIVEILERLEILEMLETLGMSGILGTL